MKTIKQIEPWIDNKESDYIKKVVSKTFLTESFETKKFEINVKKKFNSKYAISVSNWTAGMFLCLKAANIGKSDEVIVPNLTFIATVTAVLMSGATPVLCDVDEENFSLDIKKMKKLITKKTRCIIPVHLYGHCCNLDLLKKICRKKKIFILEDAAQAIGAKFGNSYLGTIGDFGGFSFYGNKIITTGEGGMILTKKKNYSKLIYALKNHGRSSKGIFKHKIIGYNFMFTEMQAAIGNIQLKKLSTILEKKRRIYNSYKLHLKSIKSIKFMKNLNKNKPVHWFSNIITDKKKVLKKYLEKNKIQTRDIFYPINLQPCFKNSKVIKNINGNFPISNKIYNNGLSLPSSYSLNDKKLIYIIKKILFFFKKN